MYDSCGVAALLTFLPDGALLAPCAHQRRQTSINATTEASRSTEIARPRATTTIILIGLIVTALNLRIVINALALVLDEIRQTTGLSSAGAGLLTTLPILCFGLVAPLAPKLAVRLGLDRALIVAMLVLIAGTLLRIAPPVPLLFLGTAVVGMGIGIANVLMPASIKRDFPGNAGTMTGLLSMMMSLSGTIGVGLTIPLQNLTGLSWRGTIALWAIPAFIAVGTLLPRLRMHLGGAPGSATGATGSGERISLWRDPLAWQVTLTMGFQSFIFYSIATWYPTMMVDHGVAKTDAGLYLAMTNFAGMFSSFLVPTWAARRHNQRAFVLGISTLFCIALLWITFAPTTAPVVSMLVFGLATGGGLGLTIAFFSLRSPDVRHAAQLSGMAQCVGYYLAATGPFLIGFLHDLSGGWHVPLLVVLGVAVAYGVTATGAARNKYVRG